MACPVLPGDPAFDMLPIGNDLEPGTVTKAPMFARWFSGLQYICQHNHGVSLHADNTYFTWSEVEATEFADLPLHNAPAILLEGAGTLDDHHVNMAAIFKAERLVAYFRFSQNGIVRQAPTTPPPPPSTGGVSAADLQKLIDHLRSNPASAPVPTTTWAERERVKESEGAVTKYRLLFGRTVEVSDPTDPTTKVAAIQLAELTPIFLQVLQTSKTTAAVQMFQDEVEHTVKGLSTSDNFLDSMSDVPIGMFDRVFISCLRNFWWAKDPYNMDKESVRDCLGTPHFAAPRQDTVQYKERVAAGRTIYCQEQVGEDKSRLVRKLSELYRFSRMHNAASVHIMLANFWLFGVLAIKDFAKNPPDIWISLKEFLMALKSPQRKNWTGLHVDISHVFYHMVGDLHGMIIPFVHLASTYNYNEAVKSKHSISPQAYADALYHARTHVLRLHTVFASGDLGEYRNVPPLMTLFSPTDSDGTKNKTTPIKKVLPKRPQTIVTHEETTGRRTSVKPGNTGPSAEEITDLKSKGLVELKGRGKPPVANNIWVDNPQTKKKSMLCTNFSTVGCYCRFGTGCGFFHF
jgi:hypothetical protein